MDDLIQQAPYLAAIIIVVALFLRYLQVWMGDWREFFREQKVDQNTVIDRLSDKIEAMSEAVIKLRIEKQHANPHRKEKV